MGIDYFEGKEWIDITRDERFFCAELYFSAKNDPSVLVELINEKLGLELPVKTDWELGFEVCLYRDFLYYNNKSIKKEVINCVYTNKKGEEITLKKFPQKRTFDLALFSKEYIIIIEAKVFQQFETVQLDEFFEDRALIKELFKPNPPKVLIIGLCRSGYKPKESTLSYFDNNKVITWKDIASAYSENKFFKQADDIKIKKTL